MRSPKHSHTDLCARLVTWPNLYSIRVPTPPLKEQAEIVRRLDASFSWLSRIENEHARAHLLLPRLDQAILEKAFRGELVPQDAKDEPASALLERMGHARNAKPGGRRRGRRPKG
jgi:type I restriction enzyme, S subunit